MTRRTTLYLVSTVAAAALLVACGASGPAATSQSKMGFFLTSANPGKGADFGGLAGADRYCQSLAASAGAGNRTWRAYLSNSAMAGSPAVNARDRIGSGPWLNAKGEVIATSVDNLHGPDNKLTKQTALTEKGAGGQRARRRREPARHPDRFHARRPRRERRQGQHLRQLDQGRRGLGHRRPP